MSPKEREEHYMKGLCFNYHKPGHLSQNCPDRKNTYGSKVNAAGVMKNIRLMDLEEKDKLLTELEQEGFKSSNLE